MKQKYRKRRMDSGHVRQKQKDVRDCKRLTGQERRDE